MASLTSFITRTTTRKTTKTTTRTRLRTKSVTKLVSVNDEREVWEIASKGFSRRNDIIRALVTIDKTKKSRTVSLTFNDLNAERAKRFDIVATPFGFTETPTKRTIRTVVPKDFISIDVKPQQISLTGSGGDTIVGTQAQDFEDNISELGYHAKHIQSTVVHIISSAN